MVQARQIVVFAHASFLNWRNDERQCVLRAYETVCKLYLSPDGNPGWAFSIGSRGKPDPMRDLYAHAFVLYMPAWVYRLTSDPRVLALADTTLSDIDRVFANGHDPGYLSKIPGPADLREQNPHMHLLEGLLALAEFSGAERYLARARSLIDLFDHVLTDRATGTVREVFDTSWRPQHPAGENLVEPGHQMEWAWLLCEWERLSGSQVGERVQRLCTHATTFGIDAKRGLVRAVVRENGTIVSSSSRIWPQTEAIRALCRVDPHEKVWPGLVSAITDNLFATHLKADLNGGWIDLVTETGEAAVDYMPPSTLYHLTGAAMDGIAACRH